MFTHVRPNPDVAPHLQSSWSSSSPHGHHRIKVRNPLWTIWAIGKTSIQRCDLGSKLSFLGLHYIVLQHILIASCASPGKLRAESLFTPPLQRLKHLWLPCAFFCSAPTVWYGMIHVNVTANHSCTKQVWIQLLEEVWMSSHSDMLHAFHSLPSVWVANHQHGPMRLPWLSSSRRKTAKPDLQVQVCRCARDEPGLTKAMERRQRESSQESFRIWAIHQRRTFCQEMVIV